eukprot:TRINITY_DN32753_c0_g1_i1.p1 TRINITY_DN32753_c0_g1~~TRINITY_DN32753_c0_g1_i1.p1  ORF type:complete len:453 (-),score=69.77 TRINITY_DN32753_c0_g1_i1:16-1374(-)
MQWKCGCLAFLLSAVVAEDHCRFPKATGSGSLVQKSGKGKGQRSKRRGSEDVDPDDASYGYGPAHGTTDDTEIGDNGTTAGTSITFGGDKHGTLENSNIMLRPEYVTAESFSESKQQWVPCASGDNCFAGTLLNEMLDETHAPRGPALPAEWNPARGDAVPDILQGQISKGGDVSKIAFEIHVNCPVDVKTMVFWYLPQQVENGHLHVFFNLTRAATFTPETALSTSINIPVSPGAINTIRMELHRSKKWKAASAQVQVAVGDMSPDFMECMEKKANHGHCVEHLGTTSQDALKIRNSEALQLSCLQGRDTSSTCRAWKECLTPAVQAHMLNVLTATLAGAMASVADQDHAGCVSPAHTNPSAWDCDCAKSFNDACDSLGMPRDHACYKSLLCQNANVCTSWKQAASCPTSSALMSALEQRQQAQGRLVGRQGHLESQHSLEQSLSAKACTR